MSLPLDRNPMNYSNVQLNVASLKAINKAPLFLLREGDCVSISGEDDEEYFKSDFDTLNNGTYAIVRISPEKSINNQTLKFILFTEQRHTYLITFIRTGNQNNCMKPKSVVLLEFANGNNHWGHGRDYVFTNYNTINIKGNCWHESEMPRPQKLSVMLSIKDDGTIVRAANPAIKHKK